MHQAYCLLVYTTTKRRLLDPTAERLENYWWRIWGSRSRELDASTVARLFVHISEGDTFVPLRGPPNRYENEKPMVCKSINEPWSHAEFRIIRIVQPTLERLPRLLLLLVLATIADQVQR